MRAYAALAIIVAAHTAHADDAPITVAAGAGLSMMRWTSGLDLIYFENDDARRSALSLHADFGYRVTRYLSIGVHAGVSTGASATEFVFYGSGPGPESEVYPIHYTPLEIGLGATFTHDRVWFAPWYGFVDVQVRHGDSFEPPRMDAFGFDLGYDLTIDPTGHRFGVMASVSHSGDWTYDPNGDSTGFLALTIGAAYRYW